MLKSPGVCLSVCQSVCPQVVKLTSTGGVGGVFKGLLRKLSWEGQWMVRVGGKGGSLVGHVVGRGDQPKASLPIHFICKPSELLIGKHLKINLRM